MWGRSPVIQRLSYKLNSGLKDIEEAKLTRVSGITGDASLITIYLEENAYYISTVSYMPEDVVHNFWKNNSGSIC